MIRDMILTYIYMFDDTLDTVASVSYILASPSQKLFGLSLTLSGLSLILV